MTSHDEELARDVGAALREIEMLFGSLARQFAKAGFEYAPGDLQRAAREMANVQERITNRLRDGRPRDGHMKDDGAHSSSDGEGRGLAGAGRAEAA